MKNLNSMYMEAREIVRDCCGDILKPIYSVKVNKRAKSFWGICKDANINVNGRKMSDGYNIEISYRILADNVPYNATMSTIVHELLHATDATGHGRKWKMYAKQVMRKHPELKITRTTPASFFGLNQEEVGLGKARKYAIQCCGCGLIHRSSRLSQSIKHPDWYHCTKCGGKFKRVM